MVIIIVTIICDYTAVQIFTKKLAQEQIRTCDIKPLREFEI